MLPTNARRMLVAALMAMASILAGTGAASAADWLVTRITGTAWITTGSVQKVSLESGGTLPPGSTVSTGSRSRVLLERGREAIHVGPASTIKLPGDTDPNGLTTILQDRGEVRFDIETRDKPHFVVRTPFLAALVKGTEFTVAINTGGASVSVHRGLVQVTESASGNAADVAAGQSATVSRSGRRGIVISLDTGWGSSGRGSDGGGDSGPRQPLDEGNGQSGLLRAALDSESDLAQMQFASAEAPDVAVATGSGSRAAPVSISVREHGLGNFFLGILDGELELRKGNATTAAAAGLGIFLVHMTGVGIYRRYRNKKQRGTLRRTVADPADLSRDSDSSDS